MFNPFSKFRKTTAAVVTAGALFGVAGVAMAVPVLGGAITGTFTDNGYQPEADWVSTTAPTFNGCTLGGVADTTATGSVSITGSGSSAQLALTLGNVFNNEVCSFTAEVQGANPHPVTINGITLNATGAPGCPCALTSTVTSPTLPDTLSGTGGGNNTALVTFTVTVPTAGGTFGLSGNLNYSAS